MNTFLREHDGPGVQHIGLRVENLIDVVKYLKLKALPFIQPPPQYYLEVAVVSQSLCPSSTAVYHTWVFYPDGYCGTGNFTFVYFLRFREFSADCKNLTRKYFFV